MSRRRGNPNFGNPMIQCRPIVTKFESLTNKLGLTTLEDWQNSKELRSWVMRNKNEYYVPEALLDVWSETVDAVFS